MVCLARQSAAVCAPSFSARTRDVHRKRLDAPPTRRANGRSGQVLRAPVRAVGSSERASDKELEMQKLEKKVEIRDTGRYPTIEDYVGETPLVRLQRLPGNTSNVILAKLEGNNPAGSVKDRPALSMIQRAESQGLIKPGDTLIEATSGNTGGSKS
eukprot:2431029-Pyramimonas_sp.AAC.1